MGKLLFVSSMPSLLLQFVVVDLALVLAAGNCGFDILHGRAWLHPFHYPLSRYWFVVNLSVAHKMILNIFWSPWIDLLLGCWTIFQGGQHKLTRVYKHEVVDCKGHVLCLVLSIKHSIGCSICRISFMGNLI